MYFVGVDIAKYHHEDAILDEAGNLTKESGIVIESTQKKVEAVIS